MVEDWGGPQEGNMCNPCKMAGSVKSDWKIDGTPLTEARKERLQGLHDQCPGKSRCFCQHRVSDE
jgi:hypothetical protein